MAIFSIALRGGVILEELILRMSLSGRAILHRILPRDYILSYAPCRGSVSQEIHLSKRAILEQLISNISLLEMISCVFLHKRIFSHTSEGKKAQECLYWRHLPILDHSFTISHWLTCYGFTCIKLLLLCAQLLMCILLV